MAAISTSTTILGTIILSWDGEAMQVELPSTYPAGIGFPLTTLLIDNHIAIDAGQIGSCADPHRLSQIESIFLTHAHLDHVAGLPILLDTIYGLTAKPPTVFASETTLNILRQHLFNNQLMPDFIELGKSMRPFVQFQVLTPNSPVTIPGYRITPIELSHTLPCLGFIVDDGTDAIVVLTDTHPLSLQFLLQQANLRAVFLEVSYPNDELPLARITGHLTVDDFLEMTQDLPQSVMIYGIHIKPRWAEQIARMIEKTPRIRAARPGERITIGLRG